MFIKIIFFILGILALVFMAIGITLVGSIIGMWLVDKREERRYLREIKEKKDA